MHQVALFALYTDEEQTARYTPLPLKLITKRRRYKVHILFILSSLKKYTKTLTLCHAIACQKKKPNATKTLSELVIKRQKTEEPTPTTTEDVSG